jgi:hypothetical protein
VALPLNLMLMVSSTQPIPPLGKCATSVVPLLLPSLIAIVDQFELCLQASKQQGKSCRIYRFRVDRESCRAAIDQPDADA